jgi:hypothetical protein
VLLGLRQRRRGGVLIPGPRSCPCESALRMADTAAWLVDRVIPHDAPVRQWLLSLQHRIRLLCAYDPEACALVRRVLMREVSGFSEGRARRLRCPRPPHQSILIRVIERFVLGYANRRKITAALRGMDRRVSHSASTTKHTIKRLCRSSRSWRRSTRSGHETLT